MPLYMYSARNGQGTIVNGNIDADDIDAARSSIQDMQLEPIEVVQGSYDATGSAHHHSSPDLQYPSLPDDLIKDDEPEDGDEQMDDDEHTHPIQFSTPDPIDDSKEEQEKFTDEPSSVYAPLLDTIRLYAGWQIGIFGLVYSVAFLQRSRDLPFEVPIINGLLLSPLVLSFTLASFLFLLLSGLHIMLGRRKTGAFVFTLLGIAIFVVYRANVPFP